jgi:hypothetical protein
MLSYRDGREVRVGDSVRHASAEAIVEQVVEGPEVALWEIPAPGFTLICVDCGRVLIVPGTHDWEDVSLVRRGVEGRPADRRGAGQRPSSP